MDGLERELRGALVVVRLDVNSPAGRALAQRWRAELTPTFLLFDAQGRETWRGMGQLDAGRIKAELGMRNVE